MEALIIIGFLACVYGFIYLVAYVLKELTTIKPGESQEFENED